VAALVAVLVVCGLLDRVGGQSAASPRAAVPPVPVAAPASALSTSWFCAGATDGRVPAAPGRVVIANSGPRAVPARVTVVSNVGTDRTLSLDVPAFGTSSVPETVKAGAPWVGAIVDVDAGQVAVGQEITGALGDSISPCATSGSNTWYFPSGSTLVNSDTVISLINPYPADSIVDLSFTTNEGVEAPEDYQGLDVPPRSMIAVDLRSHLRRRPAIATTVSVRTGSLVAWESAWTVPPKSGAVVVGTPAANNPFADPSAPVAGLSVTLGAPSAGTRWVWADGVAGNGVDERYVVYNPGSATADIRLSLDLQQYAAEPFNLSIGGYQTVEIVSSEEARIPAGVPHAAVLTSLNGVPVVAERTVAAAPGEGASGPATRSSSKSGTSAQYGLGGMLGMRLPGERWLVPATASVPGGWVTLYNPSSVAERITLEDLAGGRALPLGAARGYVVGPAARLAVRLDTRAAYGKPILLTATGEVYAEYDLYGSSSVGTSMSSAVPAVSG
jgi:hypothetical protein